MSQNPLRSLRSGVVINFAIVGVALPLIAVGLSKYFGESQENLEGKMNVAFEDRIKTKEAAANVHRMHEFIKQQTINQEADYSHILSQGRGKVKRQAELEAQQKEGAATSAAAATSLPPPKAAAGTEKK